MCALNSMLSSLLPSSRKSYWSWQTVDIFQGSSFRDRFSSSWLNLRKISRSKLQFRTLMDSPIVTQLTNSSSRSCWCRWLSNNSQIWIHHWLRPTAFRCLTTLKIGRLSRDPSVTSELRWTDSPHKTKHSTKKKERENKKKLLQRKPRRSRWFPASHKALRWTFRRSNQDEKDVPWELKPIYETNQTISWFDTINKKHWFFGCLSDETNKLN